MEMTKYQLQASSKWSFDFANEKPINANGQYQWESASLPEVPRFYHQISSNSYQVNSSEHETIFNENICPLSIATVSSRPIIVVTQSGCGRSGRVCFSQTKITGELRIFKFFLIYLILFEK
jgi:hypothetical protein